MTHDSIRSISLKIAGNTSIPFYIVYGILRADPSVSHTREHLETISSELAKLGITVTADDLAVGWGVSSNPALLTYRRHRGYMTLRRGIRNLKYYLSLPPI